jgi:hypothetical protein
MRAVFIGNNESFGQDCSCFLHPADIIIYIKTEVSCHDYTDRIFK